MPILDQTPAQEPRETWLRDGTIAWLGSVRPDGRPHLVPVWFYWDGETVLVLSRPATQKVRNVARDPRVTLALDDTRLGREVIILEGKAILLPTGSDAVSDAVAFYLAKYAALLAEMEYSPDDYVGDYSQAILIRPARFVEW